MFGMSLSPDLDVRDREDEQDDDEIEKRVERAMDNAFMAILFIFGVNRVVITIIL